ncbi:7958_t:CDS:1, partial [Paraglomus occultum]
MPKKTRKSYPVSLKLDAINYAKKTSNHAAARLFSVDHTQISRWRTKEEDLKKTRQTNRRAGSGALPSYPLAEELLRKWILNQREGGIAVTPYDVKLQMKRLLANDFNQLYPDAANSFKASDPWLRRFMNRNNLSLRRHTKVSQKLPKDLHEKLCSFHKYIHLLQNNNNFELNCIANMDETPIFFDMIGTLTVDCRGAQSIPIRTTGNEKNRLTCVLGILADGTKLQPMVIFKGKRIPKGCYPPGLVVRMQKNGWMDEILMRDWLDTILIWLQRAEDASQKRSLLVLDSFVGHITQSVKEKCRETNTVLGVIPGGLTSIVQPLDVSINKPFKDRLREKWRTWMATGEHSYTKAGNIKKPANDLMCRWIMEAWNKIPAEMIVTSFKKCGITDTLDNLDDSVEDGEEERDKEYIVEDISGNKENINE